MNNSELDKALENVELAETEYLLFSRNDNFHSTWKLELVSYDEIEIFNVYNGLVTNSGFSPKSLMICERSPIDPLCRLRRR